MKSLVKAVILAGAVIAAPVLAAAHDSPDVQLQKLLAGRVAGKPVSCIQLYPSSSSRIIDGKAIVYGTGRTIYVNQPRDAAQLRSDDILVTRTFSSQLCNVDTVRLIDRGGYFPRGFVILDKFVPYTLPKKGG